MALNEAKRKIEELMGRLDAIKGEIVDAQREIEKFASQDMRVETREAEADLRRLESRKRQIEAELNRLKRYW